MSTQPDQIKASFDRICEALKTNDGAVVASFFVEDGSLINPFGGRADGRAAVAAMYSEYFNGMLGGTTKSFEISSVRPVGNQQAFVDVEQTIYGEGQDALLVVHLTALMRNDGTDWSFVDSRPYVYSSAPG